MMTVYVSFCCLYPLHMNLCCILFIPYLNVAMLTSRKNVTCDTMMDHVESSKSKKNVTFDVMMEDMLLSLMQEQVTLGWHGDKGFKQ